MSAQQPFAPQALEACGHCVRTADGRGWLMAEVPATAEHASSYAQLFAAAPQLLEALQLLLSRTISDPERKHPNRSGQRVTINALASDIESARAALSLATGAAT